MGPDDEIQNLRKRQHDTADAVQVHAIKLALFEQELKTHAAQLLHLAEMTITEEDLTAALGPIRGEQALQKQAMDTIKSALSETARTDQLNSAIALVRSDLAAQTSDMTKVQGTLTWIGRTVIGGVIAVVIAAVVALIQVAK